MESLIATYGVLAVMLGTLAEGETALIAGGYAAHQGWLGLFPMMVAALAGAFGGDQLFFYIGRRHGRSFVAPRPGWADRAERIQALLLKHEAAVVVSFRFLYGLRVVTPMALGIAGVDYPKYLLLTLISGVAWTLLYGMGGFYLGEAMTHLLGDIERLELYGLGAILLVGGGVCAIRYACNKPDRESTND